MHVTLVHNFGAGHVPVSREELQGALESAGYEVHYLPHDEARSEGALDSARDLVVAAGGDGTVADIATRLAGRDVPLAIFPSGTSNNVATSLGMPRNLRALMEMIERRSVAPWHIGVVNAPWGSKRFVESAGVGLFARFLRRADEDPPDDPGADPSQAEARHDEIRRGRRLAMKVIDEVSPCRLSITADGRDLSGEYLFAEVLRSRFAGPSLELADEGECGGDRLTLALLEPSRRAEFREFVSGAIRGERLPRGLITHCVREVRLSWPAGEGRVDDRLWPSGKKKGAASGETAPFGAEVTVSAVQEPVSVLERSSDA